MIHLLLTCSLGLIQRKYLISLSLSEAMWRHRLGFILVKFTACYLTAPSRYPNQRWLIIESVLEPTPQPNFTRSGQEPDLWHVLGCYFLSLITHVHFEMDFRERKISIAFIWQVWCLGRNWQASVQIMDEHQTIDSPFNSKGGNNPMPLCLYVSAGLDVVHLCVSALGHRWLI